MAPQTAFLKANLNNAFNTQYGSLNPIIQSTVVYYAEINPGITLTLMDQSSYEVFMIVIISGWCEPVESK